MTTKIDDCQQGAVNIVLHPVFKRSVQFFATNEGRVEPFPEQSRLVQNIVSSGFIAGAAKI